MSRLAKSFRPRGDLWRSGDFMSLWAAQSISQVGSAVGQLALPLVAILVLDATAFEVSLLAALEFLPFLLFALPAGVWVDRLRRRPILILADVGRALALASIPVAAAFDAITIGHLYAVGFALGTLTVAFDVAYQSYLPALIGRSQLVEGNSKLELSRSVAQVGGPGLGGILVAALTAPYAVASGAVSFVASAFFLYRIRNVEPPPERHEQASIRVELIEGLRYLFGDPRWRAFSGYVATINFFSSGLVFSILLVFAVRDLGLSTAQIGLIFAVSNLGSVAAALGAGRIARRFGVGTTLIVAGVLSGMPLLFLPLATAEPAADPRGVRDRPLQRDRHQLRAGRRARSSPRAHDGLTPVCRLGNHPTGLCRWGSFGVNDRSARDNPDRSDRLHLLFPLPPLLTIPLDPRSAGARLRPSAGGLTRCSSSGAQASFRNAGPCDGISRQVDSVREHGRDRPGR